MWRHVKCLPWEQDSSSQEAVRPSLTTTKLKNENPAGISHPDRVFCLRGGFTIQWLLSLELRVCC